MIRGVEKAEDQSIINLIIQKRVVYKRCLDCGKKLNKTAGYCEKKRCGHVKNPVTYTVEEFSLAGYKRK